MPANETARTYWFSTPQRPCFEHAERHIDALDQVDRLEASDDDRNMMRRGQWHVFMVAHHRADMSGCQKTLDEVAGFTEERLYRRWHQDMRAQD